MEREDANMLHVMIQAGVDTLHEKVYGPLREQLHAIRNEITFTKRYIETLERYNALLEERVESLR